MLDDEKELHPPKPKSEIYDNLKMYIGSNGNYTQTILENEYFNEATKKDYLQKALNENCYQFLRSLDRLYSPDKKLDQADRDFILSLKFINDIYGNNTVNYGKNRTKEAIFHYFDYLKPQPDEFKIAIKEIIDNIILDMDQKIITVTEGPNAARDKDIDNQDEWRSEMDFCPDQKSDIDPALRGILSTEQFSKFSSNIKKMIICCPDIVRNLIEELGLNSAINYFKILPEEKIDLLLKFSVSPEYIKNFLNEAEISLYNIINMDYEKCLLILNNKKEVAQLYNEAGISIIDFGKLEFLKMKLSIEFPYKIVSLINEKIFSLKQLGMLSNQMFGILLWGYEKIITLIKTGNMKLASLLALGPGNLYGLIDKVNCFEKATLQMLKKFKISPQKLVTMDDMILAKIEAIPSCFISALESPDVNEDNLIIFLNTLDLKDFNPLISILSEDIQLIKKAGLTLDKLVDISSEKSKILINNLVKAAYLITQKTISVDELLDLDVDSLKSQLENVNIKKSDSSNIVNTSSFFSAVDEIKKEEDKTPEADINPSAENFSNH